MRFSYSYGKIVELFANPNQTAPSVASDLSLHCLPVTLLGVSSLQWVKFITTLTKTVVYYIIKQ